MRFSLAALLTATAVAGHVVMLPVLYLGLGGIIERSHEQMFVENVRTTSRLLAQQCEVGDVLGSPRLIANILDTAIINGDGVLAELRGPGTDVRSELGAGGVAFPAHEDLDFGENADHSYFVRTPIEHGGQRFELLLGFDERPTLVTVAAAKHRMLLTLGLYLGASMAGTAFLGWLLARPVRRLQRVAHQIAIGSAPPSASLRLETSISEFDDLASDLQLMREELVGASERRRQLEQQLQHRERLQTVGTLAGGIAHEFNNALVPITLLAETALKAQPQGSPARADLETVLAAARRARVLVRQILTFSRELDATALEPVDLADVVTEAMQLFRPLIAPGVKLELSLPEGCPAVMADRGLALQLAMNLCTNAYQALGGGVGTVAVGVARKSIAAGEMAGVEPGNYVELLVRDTGEGMEAAVAARIFEPFFSTRAVGEGTGLGLSVVHGIVQGFGARILVDSERGRGSTFRVLFPLTPSS